MNTKDVPTQIEEGAELPYYGSEEAAGADVRAYLKQDMVLEPGERKLIPTGLRFAIPKGYEIQVRPRSGLALKHGVTVLNTPGTIDSDYRGEVGVILINHEQVEEEADWVDVLHQVPTQKSKGSFSNGIGCHHF